MSESDRDGQVEELWCGEGRSITQCRTPSAKVSEQSGREFTAGNEVARACHETIQVTGPRPAFSLGLRNYFLALPSGQTPLPSSRIPRCHKIEIRPLDSRNWK